MSTNASPPLPETVIEPRTGWRLVDLAELRNHGDLLWYMIYRNVKSRYVQSSLGLGWMLVQPLVTLLIFNLIFGRVVQIPAPGGLPFSVFVFTGLVSWLFFSTALTGAANSIHGQTVLVSKVYFPRLILPLSAVLSRLADLGISLILLLGLMAIYGIFPTAKALVLVPFLVLLMTALALGVGLWLAALAVQYRDVSYSINFLTQIWMYLSVVFYGIDLVPAKYQLLYGLNPMVGIITGMRSALLGVPDVPLKLLTMATVITVVMLVSGAMYFRRSERLFADVV